VIVALLGNDAPVMQVPSIHPETGEVLGTRAIPAAHLNQSVTRVEFADYIDDDEFIALTRSTDNDRFLAMIFRQLPDELDRWAVAVNEAEQLWAAHAHAGPPSWVSAPEHPDLAAALALHFGCPVGEPQALLTNGGRDALHAQHLGTAAQPAAFNYVGLTANATAPAAGDTTLTAEIATAGGGLIRKQVTYAHTAGTNTSTLTGTFTVNGSDTGLPVIIAKIGVFNAVTAGTMAYETLLNATSTLTTVGDNVAITETVTGG
jgi:hypothetical protein